MKRLSLFVLLVMMALALALSGCNGNGNGGDPMAGGPPPGNGDPNGNGNGNGGPNGNGGGNGQQGGLLHDVSAAFRTYPESMAAQLAMLVDNPPRGGGDLGVTQSSTPDLVVTPRVSGERFELSAQDGSWSMNTDEDEVTERQSYSEDVSGRNVEITGVLFRKRSEDGDRYVDIGQVSLADETNYLTIGHWAFVPKDPTNTALFEVGWFATGSNPVEAAAIAPIIGTATYEGAGTARLTGPTPREFLSGVPEDELPETLIMDMEVRLTADFDNANGLGTIGGTLSQFQLDYDIAGEPEPRIVPVTGSFTLTPAAITETQGGVFQGALTGDIRGESVQGHWGGQFYGSQGSLRQPEAAAGTFGAGNEDVSVGGFFAGFQQ